MTLLALVGPTASGKTAIAVEVAERLGCEVVCCDSMAVYRGMDVGTARPGPAERARVPHHLLDVADPLEPFTAAAFQRLARAAIEGIRARGRLPLIVGGSGLYFRAAVDPLEFPPTDPAVRARLEREDTAALAARLAERDPVAAGYVDPANRRRVVRALEVIELTGRPLSRDGWERRAPALVAGLRTSPEVLSERVEGRLRAMLDGGLLDEVRALVARGYRDALTASRAIGYAQALAHLEGVLSEGEMIRDAARATRRLARRQMSWFLRDPRIRWFDADDIGRARAAVGAYYSEALAGAGARRTPACGS